MIGPTNAVTVTGTIDPSSVTVGSDTKPIKLVSGVATAVTNDLVTTGNVAQDITGEKTFLSSAYTRLAVKSTRTSGNIGALIFRDGEGTSTVGIEVSTSGRLSLSPKSGGYVEVINQRAYNSSNTSDIVTIGSLQSSTDVVHTSGNETVGGIKTFMSNPVSSVYSGGFTVKSIDQTQASISTQRFLGYDFVDSSSNNLSLGSFGLACRTTGTREAYIQAVSTGGTSQTVRVFSLPNGSGYAVAPARAYANAVTTDGASDVLTKAHLESAIKIGGEKTFTGQIFRMNPSADVTVAPTNNQYWGYIFVDKNNKEFGGLRVAYTTNKDNYLYLALRDIETDQQTSVYSFYKTHSTFPTRAYNSSNTMDVVTIGSLQASTDVVHTSGNETIAGVKTFTNNITVNSQFPRYIFKMSDVDITTPNDMPDRGNIRWLDKNEIEVGLLRFNVYSNGTTEIQAKVRNTDGTFKYVSLAKGDP